MRTIIAFLLVQAFSAPSYADVLQKGSPVCWGESTIEQYILANNDEKRYMEKHQCGIWNADTMVEVIQTKEITAAGKQYSISNIILRYANYGQREDRVWVFTENLSK